MFTDRDISEAAIVARCAFKELNERFKAGIELYLRQTGRQMTHRWVLALLEDVWDGYVRLN